MRSPSGTADPSTNSANAIVATPFGPNHAMNAFSAVSTCRVPASAANTATGRATNRVNATIATAAHPSANSPSSVMIAPNTTKTPSFTISTMSSLCASKHSRMSGRQMPSAIAATNTAMNPLPSGGSVAVPYAAKATPSPYSAFWCELIAWPSARPCGIRREATKATTSPDSAPTSTS